MSGALELCTANGKFAGLKKKYGYWASDSVLVLTPICNKTLPVKCSTTGKMFTADACARWSTIYPSISGMHWVTVVPFTSYFIPKFLVVSIQAATTPTTRHDSRR